jgi:hypothetical protein
MMHAHPVRDRSLPHQIILKFNGGRGKTIVSCNCQPTNETGWLGIAPSGDWPALFAIYQQHLIDLALEGAS